MGVRDPHLKKDREKKTLLLDYRAKIRKMNDTHTHKDRERERVADKRWARFADLTPSIHLSLPLSPPPLHRPLCPLCHSRCPLCAPAFVWVRPESGGPRQKNAACHGERAKVSGLRRGGGGSRGGQVSGLERHCQSRGDPLLFLGSLLIRRLPRPSLLSLISFSVHLFPGPLSFFRSERWECRKREMRQMSGMKLFARLAAWPLQARWRSTLSAPPLVALVVNTPGEVLMPPVRGQTLGQFSVAPVPQSAHVLRLASSSG